MNMNVPAKKSFQLIFIFIICLQKFVLYFLKDFQTFMKKSKNITRKYAVLKVIQLLRI